MPETTEYKDRRGKNRISHRADNGNVTYASTQGYVNEEDMRLTAIQASIELLKEYLFSATKDQLGDIQVLGEMASDGLLEK